MNKSIFSLKIYLLIVFLFSWPFQFIYIFLGESFRPILLLSMIMAGIGTFICGRYIFKDGFATAGWSWGKPKHYLYAFALPLFLWLFPTMVEQWIGLSKIQHIDIPMMATTFLLSFTLTLLPAFGEEFSWRGYLLPRLLKKYSLRKALLIHGFITWVWHLPFIVALGIGMPENKLTTILIIAIISFIPTTMHAIVFAYYWSTSKSLAVSTIYHSAFDETRDTLQASIGFGPLVEIWQMGVLTILGAVFLWKTKWLKSIMQTTK